MLGDRAYLTRQGGLARKVGAGLLILLALSLGNPAEAQSPVTTLAPGVDVAQGENGALLGINGGGLIGPRDIQMGWYDPARPSLIHGDIGAGSSEHPGILKLGADVSRAVWIQASGRTVLRLHDGRVKVCDERGCLDLMRTLRRLERSPRRR